MDEKQRDLRMRAGRARPRAVDGAERHADRQQRILGRGQAAVRSRTHHRARLVHGEWDSDCPIEMSRVVFGKLTSAPYRRWVEIGEGTHSVFLEKNRWQVFGAVVL